MGSPPLVTGAHRTLVLHVVSHGKNFPTQLIMESSVYPNYRNSQSLLIRTSYVSYGFELLCRGFRTAVQSHVCSIPLLASCDALAPRWALRSAYSLGRSGLRTCLYSVCRTVSASESPPSAIVVPFHWM